MLRWSVLLTTIVVNIPVLWQACIEQSVAMETAVTRVLITLPVVALLFAFLRSALNPAPPTSPSHTDGPPEEHGAGLDRQR